MAKKVNKGLSSELDPETIAFMSKAREAQRTMVNMGFASPEEMQSPKEEKRLTPQSPQSPVTKVNDNIDSPPADPPATNHATAYENFVEVDQLPSKGLLYRNKMTAQALKIEDLLQIQSMDEGNIHPRFSEIFGRRIRNVLPDEILFADELYLALWLRATSFPGYDFPSSGFICSNEKCKFKMVDPEYGFKFQQITFEVNEMPEDVAKKYEEYGYIPLTLRSGKEIKIFLRRRYHEGLIHEIIHDDFYENAKLPPEDYVHILKMASIIDIGEENPDLRARAKEIQSWSALDLIDILKGINNNSFSSVPIVNHICPKCQEVTPLKGYPFRPEVYIPLDS